MLRERPRWSLSIECLIDPGIGFSLPPGVYIRESGCYPEIVGQEYARNYYMERETYIKRSIWRQFEDLRPSLESVPSGHCLHDAGSRRPECLTDFPLRAVAGRCEMTPEMIEYVLKLSETGTQRPYLSMYM